MYLNSNIEIHKSKYVEKFDTVEIDLNSNIEIHKFYLIFTISFFKFI